MPQKVTQERQNSRQTREEAGQRPIRRKQRVCSCIKTLLNLLMLNQAVCERLLNRDKGKSNQIQVQERDHVRSLDFEAVP